MANTSMREQLKKYNWSSDKDYQLAVIAFKELATPTADVDELVRAARVDELEAQILILNNVIGLVPNDTEYGAGKRQMIVDVMMDLKERINELQTPHKAEVSEIVIGSMVKHDYSHERGTVLDCRNDPEGYDYQVKFHLNELDTYSIYWYKRGVLELV